MLLYSARHPCRRRHSMACLGLAALLAGCSSDGGSAPNPDPTPSPPGEPPASATVQATAASAFQPAGASVRTNGTVTWNFGSLGHNVTFSDVVGAPADIGGVNMGTSVSRTFGTAGSFPYQCTIHPGMSGSVTVSSTTGGGGGGGGGSPY